MIMGDGDRVNKHEQKTVFEVIDHDGKVKMSTEHYKCIYQLDTLKKMETVGYKFRVNGKRWKPGQAINEEQNSINSKKKGRKAP